MLKKLQQQFQDFCLNHKQTFTDEVANSDAVDAVKRLEIYFESYRLRLLEILRIDYPKLLVLLGANEFEKMSLQYIQQCPSSHFSARYFGENLSEFLQQHSHYQNFEVLAEMAHFEWNLGLTLDRADAPIVSFDDLKGISSDKWPQLSFHFHPSVNFCICKYNTVSLWMAIDNNQAQIPAKEIQQPQTWVCWRDKSLKSQFSSLNAIEEIIFFNLWQQKTLTTVCEDLSRMMPEDKVPMTLLATLKSWLDDDMITTISGR